MRGREVTVLGAGVAGLALARALALQGAAVTVLEQAQAIAEVGAGIQISPNAAVVLQALGLGPALTKVATRTSAVRLCNGITGSTLVDMNVAALRPDQGYYFVHRADLIDLLAEGAKEAGVTLKLSHRVAEVDLAGQRPRLVLANGASLSTDFLIGADGLHSMTRAALNGGAEPFFTHQVAWRALIPETPGADPVAEVHMARGRHLVSYPLRGGTLRNLVAVEERQAWADESWALRDDPARMRQAFQDFSPRVQGWLNAVDECHLWGLFRHPVAARWYQMMPAGAVAILGDAAHPTLPFLAQGAAMGLEDAFTLSRALSDRYGMATAMARWQAYRHPRTSRIVQAANRNAKIYHMGGPQAQVLRMGMKLAESLRPGFALSRFDWIYGHDVTNEF